MPIDPNSIKWDAAPAGPQPIIRAPVRAPTGYAIVGPNAVAPLSGGPEDPNTVAKIERIKAGISVGAQNAATQARMQAELAADAIRRQRDKQDSGQASPLAIQLQQRLANDEILRKLRQARGETTGWSTSIAGSLLKYIPGTQAKNLSSDISTISGRITKDVLGQLKSQSSTGASGFGALSEKEGQLLRDSVASLDQSQSKEHFLGNLRDVENHYRALQAIQNNEDPRLPSVAKKYGIKVGSEPKTIHFNDLPD